MDSRELILQHLLIVDSEKNPLKVTISLGVAGFPSDAKSNAELIKKADEALYQAKKTGKNKVIISD